MGVVSRGRSRALGVRFAGHQEFEEKHLSRLKYLPMRGLLSYGLMFCIQPLTFWCTLHIHTAINDTAPSVHRAWHLLVKVVLAATAGSVRGGDSLTLH